MPYDLVETINPADTANIQMELKQTTLLPGTGFSNIFAATSAPSLKLYKVVSLMVSYPKADFVGPGIIYTLNYGDTVAASLYVKPGENIVIAKSIQPIYASGEDLKHKASATGLKVSISYQEFS